MPKNSAQPVGLKRTKSQFMHCSDFLNMKLVQRLFKSSYLSTVSTQLSPLFSTSKFTYLTGLNSGLYTLSTVLTIRTIKFNYFIINT